MAGAAPQGLPWREFASRDHHRRRFQLLDFRARHEQVAAPGLSDTGGNCSTGNKFQQVARAGSGIDRSRETGCFYRTIITTLRLWGILGITLSTIFYTGGSGSGGNGPDGLSYSDELQKMVTLNNTAMSTYAENEGLTTVLQGQFFNQPTGSAIPADMMQICASGGGKPRLVL